MCCCELYDLVKNIMEIIYNYNMEFQIIGEKDEILMKDEVMLFQIKSKRLFITI